MWTCKICGRKTHWDESYGYEEFIVCPCCFYELAEDYELDGALAIVFKLGSIIRNKNKKKG